MLKELALSFKKFAKDVKAKVPIFSAMLLLYARWISPPKAKACRPLSQLKVSFKTAVVSPRPWGSPFGAQKNNGPATWMSGKPVATGEPAGRVMLNFAGSSSAFGRNVKWILLNPIRTVLASEALKV